MPNPSRKPSDVLQEAVLSNIEKFPNDFWVFHFGDAVHLSAESPWRLVSPALIVVTREDDGQKFGLETPVNAEAELRQILIGRRVTFVDVNSATSDLRIGFDSGVVLKIVNLSSGYESWTLNHNDGFIWVGRNS